MYGSMTTHMYTDTYNVNIYNIHTHTVVILLSSLLIEQVIIRRGSRGVSFIGEWCHIAWNRWHWQCWSCGRCIVQWSQNYQVRIVHLQHKQTTIVFTSISFTSISFTIDNHTIPSRELILILSRILDKQCYKLCHL